MNSTDTAPGSPQPGASAPLLEVFASYQGEGLYVGEPQTFLRLAGCPLRCRYCDTKHSWPTPSWTQDGDSESSWVTPFQAILRVAEAELDEGPDLRPIAVTGGEPLIWPDFLLGLADVAGERRLHLETAGHDCDALERVLPAFDHLSLDLKLALDLGQPEADQGLPSSEADWDSLRPRQLQLAKDHVARGGTASIKLVVTKAASAPDSSEFESILSDLERLGRGLPLFLAPESPRDPRAAFDPVVLAALGAR
jgi:7-carboxy-7-deazaguanine synthase